MKIESLRGKLRQPISLAEKMVGKNLALPVLGCVLLEAEDHHLVIRSTNLDVGLEITVPVKVGRGGRVAIRAGILGNLLSGFSADGRVVLELAKNQLVVETPGHQINIKSEPAADFPIIPKLTAGPKFTLPAAKLLSGLRSVVYAASSSSIKPEIASVHLYQDGGDLVLVATDSFRLAERRLSLEGKIPEDFSVILPIRNAAELMRILDAAPDLPLTVTYNKNQIAFSLDQIYFTSRLIDGVYPDYRQIIPKQFTGELVFIKQDLLESLKLVNLFIDRLNKVVLKTDPARKTVEIKSAGELGEDTAELPAVISGKGAQEINFNLKYLLECLPAISADSLSIKFSEANRPLLVSGVGEPGFTYLVMPLSR